LTTEGIKKIKGGEEKYKKCASLFTAEIASCDLIYIRRHYNQEMFYKGSTLHAPLRASGGRCR